MFELRPMTIEDYDTMTTLWKATAGVRLVAADSREGIGAFLDRNPGMSIVCTDRGELIGTAMCGHDGRRGYLYHVAVKPEYRGKGIGTALVQTCLDALMKAGIDKCHVFVLADNGIGNAFWKTLWMRREDITLYSRDI